jgi:iron(III) transport system ATP-binding protein
MTEQLPGAQALDRTPHTAATVPEGAPYLEIRNLWKAFGDFVALRDVNLDIRTGEFVCFLGPSGCGKTTLLRAIAGLDPQSRGTIRQGGTDISTLPASGATTASCSSPTRSFPT